MQQRNISWNIRDELRILFVFLQNQSNRRNLGRFLEANRKELSEAPRDLSLAIASLSHTEGIRRYIEQEELRKGKGEKVNMCQAIDEMIEEGKKQVRKELEAKLAEKDKELEAKLAEKDKELEAKLAEKNRELKFLREQLGKYTMRETNEDK